MKRRILLSIVLFGVLAGAATFILQNAVRAPAGEALADAAAVHEGRPDAGPRHSPLALAKLQLPRRGAIAGRVVDGQGRSVSGAEVSAAGPVARRMKAGADGAYRFPDLEPGDYLLYAASGVLSSEPVGPVPLGSGEELRDITLVLDVGAALAGTVLDARDLKPIPGASVIAAASGAIADEKGRFRLTGLPGGTVMLSASAEGYVPRTSEVELARGRERTGAEVHLDRAGRVHGRVTAQGQGLGGVEVHAARYGFAARLSSTTPVAVTAMDGTFGGSVPPGRMELVARAMGYAEARTEEFELGPGEDREANLTLGQGGAVFGTVRDAEGTGVAGCRVEAWDTIHGRTTAAIDSGAGGQYWLAGVPQAIYLVVASCAAGRAEVTGIKVAEGAQVQVDLALGAGAIAGKVVDATGKPVAGAAIAVRPDGSAAPESPAGASRADGTFMIGGLAGTRFAVSATAPQGRAEKSGVAPGTKDLVLSLGSADLVGTVAGDRGEPIADFVVYAEPTSLEAGRPRSQRFLSPIGEFRMALSPGRYSVRVGAPSYSPTTVPGVEVRAGTATAKVRITLTRGAIVKGRTVDPAGKPIPGVRIASSPNMMFAFGRAAPVPSGVSGVSDEAGTFILTGVPPSERIHLFATKEGWQQRGPAFASAGSGAEVADVEIKLYPTNRESSEREFAGVGMTLASRDGVIQVMEVFEGGPAREAGLRPGDVVVTVDGAPVPGDRLQDAINRIRGEVGTTVVIAVRRDGQNFTVAIPRAIVKF